MIRAFKLLLSLSMATIVVFASINVQAKTQCLTILHTNDHHGAFWKNKKGEAGMAAQMTLVKKIRKEAEEKGCHVLLLSAGDIHTGSPESDMLFAEPDIKAMNMMGYDAMAVGNHEFDIKYDILQEQEKMADFPFLSANIFDKRTDHLTFKPFVIKNFTDKNNDPFRVAIMGLTSYGAAKQSVDFPFDKLFVKNPIKIAKMTVPALRSAANVVIALSHIGFYKDGKHDSTYPGDVTLARNVNGIDVIVGGHTHTNINKVIIENGTPVVQAGASGKFIGKLDLLYNNGKTKVESYELIPINLKGKNGKLIGSYLKQDKKLIKLLKPYYKQSQKMLAENIGKAIGHFEGDRKFIRNQETELGNLIALNMRQLTGADIAIANSGAIRASLNKGNISVKDVLRVQAFKLKFVTVDFTGRELWKYLENVAQKKPGTGGFPQIGGAQLTTKNGKLVDVKIINGSSFKPLNKNKKYRLALYSGISAGIDNYPVVENHPTYKVTDIIDYQALIEYIKKNSPLDPDDYKVTNYIVRN